ncbi:MAG: hypothetical protein MUE67_12165 [Anaerolineales bacterium]|jgi:hypothetical protein|nr:hypothetical protein [Anaerolineales bacterium]
MSGSRILKYWRFNVWLGLLVAITACNSLSNNQQPTPAPETERILLITAQAISTRIAENAGLVQTSQALETQAARRPTPTSTQTPTPDLRAVQNSQATSPVTNLPADVPLPPGDQRDLFVSRNLVSFLIQTDINQLILFFENQMPIHGWTKVMNGSSITQSSALLNYTKDGRSLSISLRLNPLSNLTGVVITVQE